MDCWQAAEVNLASQNDLKMEMLTAKTPEMVRKALDPSVCLHLLRADVEATEASDHNPFNFHPSRKTAVQSNDPVGNDGKINSPATVSSSAGAATHLLPVRPHRTQGSETQTQAFSTNAATTSCLES